MSYCVNCGVKLSKSEKKCPLCKTRVINPNKLTNDYEPAYPTKVEKFKKINIKFVSKLIMMLLLLISLTMALCDFIINKEISWSIYVVASMLFLGSHLSYLMSYNIYIPHTICFISTELYIFVIAYLNNGMHWYIYLILPFGFILWLYVLICTLLIKKSKKSALRRVSTILLYVALALIGIESGIDLYKYDVLNYSWSLYASLPIVIVSILIFCLSYNQKIIDEIKQRIFI